MIVDRVVLGRLAPRVLAWLAVVVGVYAIADLADALVRPAPWSRLFLLRVPAMLFQGLPVALAAAAAHLVTTLRRTGEWTAISVAGIAAVASWGVGDAIAPAAARAHRAAGGGPPPGAVVLPMPAADWAREDGALVRAGRTSLRVSFTEPGPPRIEDAPGIVAPRSLPPASDLGRSELLALERHAGDALPYALEASFRPLVAATALLLPLVVLTLVARRPLGPRAAALATVLACLVAYGVIAGAHAVAAVGTATPRTAAGVAAVSLVAAAALLAAWPAHRPRC